MPNTAIRVENLGKLYRIGGRQEKYHTLRDTISDAFVAPFRRAQSLLHRQPYGAAGLEEEIWALKDVSFEVKHGETIGIIGRNGAGKSTLLKILSRITEPSAGYADIYGRVGALLEVGTGFHPELTGRENIYLNGAILGMSRQDIDRRFDEMVDFAGVEKFIDTPVKHYSSGMGLRLGFAVAAHLEPDILVVDEVLAVGDAEFQKKCLGKMTDVAGEGRTVLFVSHNLSAISAITNRCLLLKQGELAEDDETSEIISAYLSESKSQGSKIQWAENRPGDESFEFIQCVIGDGEQNEFTGEVEVTIDYCLNAATSGLRVGFDLLSSDGVLLFRSYHDDIADDLFPHQVGTYRSKCVIPQHLLNNGIYYITLRAGIHGVRRIVTLENVLSFSIITLNAHSGVYFAARPGVINPLLNWSTEFQAE